MENEQKKKAAVGGRQLLKLIYEKYDNQSIICTSALFFWI
jgi:hypothetical protein